MRRLLAISVACLGVFLIPAVAGGVVSSSPLEAVDLGVGVFAPEAEFAFADPETAPHELLSFLETTPGMADHLRAIGAYYRRFHEAGRLVQKQLSEVLPGLRKSKRGEAQVELAFLLGLLAQEASGEARAGYLKEIAPLVALIPRNHPAEPWSRLVAAMLFASFPELHGNWLDEALYAQSLGYDSAEIQLAVGSFMLRMDLFYGGNERLQWFVYLAFSRAQALAPENEALRLRIRKTVNDYLEMPGYRPSKLIKALAGATDSTAP